jgi:zinc/manganese transport system substrate-binding protein
MKALLLVLAVVASGIGCASDAGTGGGPGASTGSSKAKVVVTTDILGDVTRNILGDQVDIEVLMPNALPPRNYQPAATDLNQLMGAQLIVAIGLGLEAGLQPALVEARAKGTPILEVGLTLNPIPLGGSEANSRPTVPVAGSAPSAPERAAPAAAPDPHLWLDPDRMKQAITLITDQAITLKGVDAAAVRRQRDAYVAQIDKADEEIQSTLAAIAEDRRRLVTVHDNLGYFADRYGFTIAGVIVPANRHDQDTALTDAEIAAAATSVAEQKASAIVADVLPQSTADAAAVAQAVEGSSPAVVPLTLEALGGPGSGAETYLGLLTTNAHALAARLA